MATDLTASVRPASTAPYRTDLVLSLLGVWFSVGLFLDAWAHNNQPQLESFFTPWHAAFYSGFSATAAWVLWTCRHAFRDGERVLSSVPVGYAPTIIAVVVFAVSAFGDLIWHTVFGIEQSINILFSPTHLLLVASMIVIVTTPIRSRWADPALPAAPGLGPLLPAVLGAGFATTLVLLFLQYANVLTDSATTVWISLSGASGPSSGSGQSTASVTSAVAVTNVVLLLPVLTLARRWRLPLGAVTIVYAAVGGLSCAVTGFRNLPMIIGFLVAGVLVDLLAAILRPGADRLRQFRAFGFLAPLITWTTFLITAALTVHDRLPGRAGSLPAPVLELWTGLPIVAALVGWLLAVLLIPTVSTPPADTGPDRETETKTETKTETAAV
jgi:hypothetical protein